MVRFFQTSLSQELNVELGVWPKPLFGLCGSNSSLYGQC